MPLTDPPTGDAALAGVYYIDYLTSASLPPIVDFSDSEYICTLPEDLSMNDEMGGIGEVDWNYTLSAIDVEGNPVVSHDFINPWRTWYRIRCGTTVIMAGPITDVNGKLSEQTANFVGNSWEAYFPRWQFPFDPRPDHVNDYCFAKTFMGNEGSASGAVTPAGLCYQANNRDVALIAHDLLVRCRDGVDGDLNRMYFDFGEFNNPVGITSNYQYTLGDDSGIDSVLSTLATTAEGFDWWIGQDMKARVGSPYRFGSQLSPAIKYTIDVTTPGLIDFNYDNQGILGTHVLGNGAGLAAQTTMAAAYGFLESQQQFTRLDTSFDYGDVRNQTQLNNLTKKSLSLIINPVREVLISMDPRRFTVDTGIDFWSTFRRGVAMQVVIDLGFHQVSAPYMLKSWTAQDDEDTGNFQVDMTCEKIEPEVADFGNPAL